MPRTEIMTSISEYRHVACAGAASTNWIACGLASHMRSTPSGIGRWRHRPRLGTQTFTVLGMRIAQLKSRLSRKSDMSDLATHSGLIHVEVRNERREPFPGVWCFAAMLSQLANELRSQSGKYHRHSRSRFRHRPQAWLRRRDRRSTPSRTSTTPPRYLAPVIQCEELHSALSLYVFFVRFWCGVLIYEFLLELWRSMFPCSFGIVGHARGFRDARDENVKEVDFRTAIAAVRKHRASMPIPR